MGAKPVAMPAEWGTREHTLHLNGPGKILFRVRRADDDSKPANGWVGKGSWWVRIVNVLWRAEDDAIDADDFVRALRDQDGEIEGYRIWSREGTWDAVTDTQARRALSDRIDRPKLVERLMGRAITHRFTRVCLPFEAEFLSGRRWNLGSPQTGR